MSSRPPWTRPATWCCGLTVLGLLAVWLADGPGWCAVAAIVLVVLFTWLELQ